MRVPGRAPKLRGIDDDVDNIEILKQALPYIKSYRDKTFIVKLGGELAADTEVLDGLASDISLLYEIGIRIVIIHGGGPQLSKLSEKLGIVVT